MEFSRIGKHTIRCVISEDEISDLGFTLEEIMKNGERTQEFMNQIFDMAEQRFETKFEMGIKTVRADFMSDHTLSLTFSEYPGTEGVVEHLKDIVNGLLNSIPRQKWEEIQEQKQKNTTKAEEDLGVIVTLVFDSLDVLIRYSKMVTLSSYPPNTLYKYKNEYMLIVDFRDMDEEQVKRMSAVTDEYAKDILVGNERKAHIVEHGEVILKECALEQLKEL